MKNCCIDCKCDLINQLDVRIYYSCMLYLKMKLTKCNIAITDSGKQLLLLIRLHGLPKLSLNFLVQFYRVWQLLVCVIPFHSTEFPALTSNYTDLFYCCPLTHCGLEMPYGDIDLGRHWPNGLLPESMKPLHEPLLTYHQKCSLAYSQEQFHKKISLMQSVTCVSRLHL